MASTVFVKNLSYKATEDDISAHFSQFGVSKVHILIDKESGRATGIAFVDVEDAEAAIEALNNVEFQGRRLMLDKARPRAPRRENSRY